MRISFVCLALLFLVTETDSVAAMDVITNLQRATEILQIYRSSGALDEKDAEKYGIVPGSLYTEENVENVWSDGWSHICKNTVRINALMVAQDPDGVVYLPFIGTGFFVHFDEMPKDLRGRVILTCAHCIGYDSGKFETDYTKLETRDGFCS
ncbi:MAG: hypothetical protein LBB25_00035 [Holosporaceae bacterium]|jgi:hypothetical protein|nr:hypothetical protein [Holosporaceae bacterium]